MPASVCCAFVCDTPRCLCGAFYDVPTCTVLHTCGRPLCRTSPPKCMNPFACHPLRRHAHWICNPEAVGRWRGIPIWAMRLQPPSMLNPSLRQQNGQALSVLHLRPSATVGLAFCPHPLHPTIQKKRQRIATPFSNRI